jgi:peptidyl-prolyl cis-trans isomerase D
VQKTGMFSRTSGGEGIAANPQVIKAAFSNAVLAEGNASDPIELGPNHIVIARVDEHEKPEPRPLEQVRDEIRQKLVGQEVAKAARERADTLFGRLSKGESLEKVAGEVGAKVEDGKDIGRNAANLDHALVDAAFALDRPQDGKPVPGKATLAGDAYALIELTTVHDADPSKLDAKTREAARNQLRQGVGTEAVRGYIDSLRKGAKIEVAEDRLQ